MPKGIKPVKLVITDPTITLNNRRLNICILFFILCAVILYYTNIIFNECTYYWKIFYTALSIFYHTDLQIFMCYTLFKISSRIKLKTVIKKCSDCAFKIPQNSGNIIMQKLSMI